MQRTLAAVVLALIGLTAAGVLALYPYGGTGVADQGAPEGFVEERLDGVIVDALEDAGADTSFFVPGARALILTVETDDGRFLTIEAIDETGLFAPGRSVVLQQISAPGLPDQYAVVDFPRTAPLGWAIIAFAAAVIALGRWQGVRALVGLGLSGLVVVGFAIPALLAGRDGTLVALVAALAVMLVTLVLSHGWNTVTHAAATGTAVALVATVLLALGTVQLTALTGLSSEDVQLVRVATDGLIDVRGLLLAGIVLGTLGVLDDVTVSQASTVAALRRALPDATNRHVFGEALRVGRDHIAATVNTLFLAYAGAALPLLILFQVGGGDVTETLSSELVAQEVVRTVVGSIGLVLAVPLTTAVAVLVMDGTAAEHGGHVHGEVPGAPAPEEAPDGAGAEHPGAADSPTADSSTADSSTADSPTAAQPPPADGRPEPAEPADEGEAWEQKLRGRYGLGD